MQPQSHLKCTLLNPTHSGPLLQCLDLETLAAASGLRFATISLKLNHPSPNERDSKICSQKPGNMTVSGETHYINEVASCLDQPWAMVLKDLHHGCSSVQSSSHIHPSNAFDPESLARWRGDTVHERTSFSSTTTPCVRSQQSSGVYTGGFQQSCVSRTPKKKSGSVYSRSGTCKHGIVKPDKSEALVQIANSEIQNDFTMESKNSRNSIPSRTTRRKLRNATPQTSIDPNPQKQSLPGR